VELTAFLVSEPPGKVCMVVGTAFADSPGEAATALAPLDECPVSPLTRTTSQPTPFETLFDTAGSMWPEGHRYRVETFWSRRPTGEILTAIGAHFTAAPPKTVLLLALYPRWTDGVPGGSGAAFSMVARTYGGLWTTWERPEDDAASDAWHRGALSLLEPFTDGHYLGETDIVEDPTRAERAFSPESWRRLQELRRKLDPDGVFHGFSGGLG